MTRRWIALSLLMFALALPALAVERGNAEKSVDTGSVLVSGESKLLFDIARATFKGGDITDNPTGFNIGIRCGYFVIDGLVVGGKFSVDYKTDEKKIKGQDSDTTTNTTLDFLPFGRYYFLQNKWYKPFVNFELGVRYISDHTENLDTTTTLFGFDAGGGIALFLVDHVSLDFGLNLGYFFGNLGFKPKNVKSKTESGGAFVFNMGMGISTYF